MSSKQIGAGPSFYPSTVLVGKHALQCVNADDDPAVLMNARIQVHLERWRLQQSSRQLKPPHRLQTPRLRLQAAQVRVSATMAQQKGGTHLHTAVVSTQLGSNGNVPACVCRPHSCRSHGNTGKEGKGKGREGSRSRLSLVRCRHSCRGAVNVQCSQVPSSTSVEHNVLADVFPQALVALIVAASQG
jgi:hypothetical protein